MAGAGSAAGDAVILLVFDRAAEILTIISGSASVQFPAANNAQRSSRGPWPSGVFKAEALLRVDGPDGALEGKFGRWFLRFTVPDRDGDPDTADGPGVGMAIHAGRTGETDLAGRSNHRHATDGCIRTVPDAMVAISREWDRLGGGTARLWVV